MAAKKYGLMPKKPEAWAFAKIKGDAGLYDVWGIEWLNHRVLVYRASGYEWVSIDRVQLLTEEQAEAERS